MPLPDNFKVQPDVASLNRYAVERIVRVINATLEMNAHFSLALSGGSTPKPVYELLGKEYRAYVDWTRVHLFFGDERTVPPDDPQSNYGMVHTNLLQYIAIPPENVHRIRGEDNPELAAQAYETEIRTFFQGETGLFDLQLLGIGDDAHTASLFPHTAAIHEQEKWVLAHYVEKLSTWRITLTPPALLASSNIMFIIAGASKAPALKAIMEGEYQPDLYPTQVLARSSHEHIVWLVDEAAIVDLSAR